jgi:glutathione S-transferase
MMTLYHAPSTAAFVVHWLLIELDLHAERGLAPAPGTPARAAYYQWMFFLANTLQPAYRAWFYPTEPAGEANVEATQRQAREHIEWAWDRVAAHLETGGPYLLGEQLSVADFLTTMLMRWSRNMPKRT